MSTTSRWDLEIALFFPALAICFGQWTFALLLNTAVLTSCMDETFLFWRPRATWRTKWQQRSVHLRAAHVHRNESQLLSPNKA